MAYLSDIADDEVRAQALAEMARTVTNILSEIAAPGFQVDLAESLVDIAIRADPDLENWAMSDEFADQMSALLDEVTQEFIASVEDALRDYF